MGLTKYSSSAESMVSVISGSAVTEGFRSSSPMERVTCQKKKKFLIVSSYIILNTRTMDRKEVKKKKKSS